MKCGERAIVQLRPEYAYAQAGCEISPPPGCPPDAALAFDLQLVKWYPAADVKVGPDTEKLTRQPYACQQHNTDTSCNCASCHQPVHKTLQTPCGHSPLTILATSSLYLRACQLLACVVMVHCMVCACNSGHSRRSTKDEANGYEACRPCHMRLSLPLSCSILKNAVSDFKKMASWHADRVGSCLWLGCR